MRFFDALFQVRHRDLFHRPLPALTAGKVFQPGTQRLVRRHLRRRAHSRLHGKAHLIDGILAVHGQLDAEPFGVFLAEQINKLTPHLFQIPCPLTAHAVRHLLEHQRLLERGVVLGFRDPVKLAQTAQHVVLATDGGTRVTVGVILGGSLGQARDEGAFGQREILGVLPEVRPSRSLHAVRVGPEEGLVQIDCQDFIFGKVMLQTVREDGFLDLALVAAFRRQEQALDHLLRDGAAALALCAGLEVDKEGAENGDRVHALVFIEFSVLSGQKSLGEHLGHLIERNEETVFPIKRTDDAPVTRQNGGGECGTVIGDTGKPRQIPDSPKIDANHGCEAEGHEHTDDGSKKKKHSLHEQGDTLFPPLRKERDAQSKNENGKRSCPLPAPILEIH